jgi:hypothetical protein
MPALFFITNSERLIFNNTWPSIVKLTVNRRNKWQLFHNKDTWAIIWQDP